MDDKQFLAVQDKLEKLTKLIALMALRQEESEQEKIRLLDSMGFRQIEIARILNKTPDNIGMVIRRLRKKTDVSKTVQSEPGQEERVAAEN